VNLNASSSFASVDFIFKRNSTPLYRARFTAAMPANRNFRLSPEYGVY